MRIPVRFHRRNGRQIVITHGVNNSDVTDERESNWTLVSAVAKAYRWQAQLESGEHTAFEDLAAANGVRTCVGPTLRLGSLAPEIVERILDGDEPESIGLAKLRNDLTGLAFIETGCGASRVTSCLLAGERSGIDYRLLEI